MFTYIEVPEFLLDVEKEKKEFNQKCDEFYKSFAQNYSLIQSQFSRENFDCKLSAAESTVKDLKKEIHKNEVDINKLDDEIVKLSEIERCLKNDVELKEREKLKERLKLKKLYAKRNELLKLYGEVCQIEYRSPCFFKVSLNHDNRSYVLLKSDEMDFWTIEESSLDREKLKKLRSYIAKTENLLAIIPVLSGALEI